MPLAARIAYSFCCYILFFLYPLPLKSQSINGTTGWPPVQVLGVDQGLPQAFVSGVIEDSDGFMWISTLSGLVRYDGRQMLPFQYEAGNATSLTSNSITHMRKGAGHTLWLYYSGGELDQLDTRTGKTRRYPELTPLLHRLPLGWDLYPSQLTNDLWGTISQRGLFHYDGQTHRFTRYNRASGLPSDTINAVVEDRSGGLWLVYPAGITHLEPTGRTNHFVRFDSDLQRQLTMMAIHLETVNAWIRPDGWMLFNSHTQIIRVNLLTGAIVRTTFSAQPVPDQPMMTRQPVNGTSYLVANGTLYRYTDAAGVAPIWQYHTTQKAGLDDLLGTGIWLTQAGVLWLGANTKGLYRFDLTAFPIHAYANQHSFCVDALQQQLGLSLPNLFHWNFNNPALASSYLFRQVYDAQGNFWMGIDSQIGVYSFGQKKFTLLPPLPIVGVNDPTQAYLRGIAVTPERLWALAYSSRLYAYNRHTERWEASFSWRDRVANALWGDQTNLWITTQSEGLVRFTPRSEQWQSFHFRNHRTEVVNEQLLDIQPDPTQPDWLWISSYQGLIGFNKRTGRYRRFTKAQGLPDNTIYSILPDKQGYLWLGTNRGLCRFHPITHTVLTLGLSDGLPGLEFNRFHRLRFPDGKLAFGGIDGWITFDPQQFQVDKRMPVTTITGLRINNRPVDTKGQPTSHSVLFNNLTNLELNYDQNYLTFAFAALAYHQPDQVVFRYLLDGYDNEWSITRQPAATYTKLPSGTYTLRVNAANRLGQWSPQVRSLTIHISPPFWASVWAYGFYLLLAGGALWSYVRFRNRRMHERQELAFRQEQANELRRLDEAKTRFFTNVSHELRTPLTLILGPLDSVLSRRQVDARDERLLRTVDRSARQLRDLVNELLDLSRLENNQLTVNAQVVQLGAFFDECLSLFKTQAQFQGITLQAEWTEVAALQVLIDTEKLRRIVQNLVANACKFTSPGGKVTLRAITQGEQLQLAVIDTGRGIHPDDLPHIFERYFQTRRSDVPTEGGTGIGLALSQELVQLLGGTLRVESTLGQGSSFFVVVPFVLAPIDTVLPNDVVNDEFVDNQVVMSLVAPPVAPSETAETILIVEDNLQLQTYLTTILSPAFRVLTAPNGQVALTTLSEQTQLPALIVSDIMMPVMDGFQLLETLKSAATYRAIPIIMLTARADNADKLRALRLGVDDYLLKPFDETELMARITALLHNQHERQHQLVIESDAEAISTDPLPLSADDQHWLSQLEQLTNHKLGRFDLTADELADALAMSRRTFYRTIKRLTGLTPAQYMAEARFQQARRLFETRQLSSIKQVAYAVGYRQTSHFAQLYQQRFGKHPADYQ